MSKEESILNVAKILVIDATTRFIGKLGLEDSGLREALHEFRRDLKLFEGRLNKVLPPEPSRFECLHCGQDCADWYTVHDEVWHAAVPNQAELRAQRKAAGKNTGLFLHLHCLEQRLGRRVKVADLADFPINDSIRYFANRPTVTSVLAEAQAFNCMAPGQCSSDRAKHCSWPRCACPNMHTAELKRFAR